MSIFSKIGHTLGSIGQVAAIPLGVVNPLLGAAVGGASGVLGEVSKKHPNLLHGLEQTALGAGLGYGAGKLAQEGGGGTSGLFKSIGNIAGHSSSASTAGGVTGLLGGLAKNPALLLGGAGLLNSAHQQSGADDSRNQAINLLETDMQRRQPLFDALLKRLSEGAPPAQTFGYHDPGNPYAASYR